MTLCAIMHLSRRISAFALVLSLLHAAHGQASRQNHTRSLFAANDAVAVRADVAVIKVDRRVLARPPRGTGFDVLHVTGPWVWVQWNRTDSTSVTGWIHEDFLTLREASWERAGASLERDRDGRIVGLDLSNAKSADRLLLHIALMPDLREIYVGDSDVTDASVARLRSIKRLQVLDLSGSQVSNKSLSVLADMRSLQVLSVSNTRLTKDGVRRLRAVMPKCMIEFEESLR